MSCMIYLLKQYNWFEKYYLRPATIPNLIHNLDLSKENIIHILNAVDIPFHITTHAYFDDRNTSVMFSDDVSLEATISADIVRGSEAIRQKLNNGALKIYVYHRYDMDLGVSPSRAVLLQSDTIYHSCPYIHNIPFLS